MKVKSLFRGWVDVSREQAKKFVNHLYNSSTGWKKEDKVSEINKRLKGITYEELKRD